MPNFTISEILTIMLVILVVFGPQRLPEMAQKAGQWVRQARRVVGDLRREFEGEWQEVAQPLKDVRDEVQGVRDEVSSSMTSLSDDVARAKEEIEAEVADTGEGLESEIEAAREDLRRVDGADGGEADGDDGAPS